MSRVLEITDLQGGYGSVQILHGIDMHVDEGEFVTIIQSLIHISAHTILGMIS